MNIYLDTCIWINFFKKEEKFTKNGQIAKSLINKIIFDKKKNIFYSGFVLKELDYKLKNFSSCKNFLRKDKQIIFVKATNKDYLLARNLETKYNQRLSFFDFLHLAICINNNFTLVSIDKDLIKIGKEEYEQVFNSKNLLQRIDFA